MSRQHLIECEKLLEEFVENIDDTGGLGEMKPGVFAPLADPSWSDLGDLYIRACKALGREPVIERIEEDDGDG